MKKADFKQDQASPIDPMEIIKKCLSCEKKRCTNCIVSMSSKEKKAYVHEG